MLNKQIEMDIEERLAVTKYSQVECYQQGCKDAVDKAYERIVNNMTKMCHTDDEIVIDKFSKAMEE